MGWREVAVGRKVVTLSQWADQETLPVLRGPIIRVPTLPALAGVEAGRHASSILCPRIIVGRRPFIVLWNIGPWPVLRPPDIFNVITNALEEVRKRLRGRSCHR